MIYLFLHIIYLVVMEIWDASIGDFWKKINISISLDIEIYKGKCNWWKFVNCKVILLLQEIIA